jgi:hypothetical protein
MYAIIIFIAVFLIIILIGKSSKKKKQREIDETVRREYMELNRQSHRTHKPGTSQQSLQKNVAEKQDAGLATATSERPVEKSSENTSGNPSENPIGNSAENPLGNSTASKQTVAQEPFATIMFGLSPMPSQAESAGTEYQRTASGETGGSEASSAKNDIPDQFKPMEYIPVDNHENQSSLSK